MKRKEAAINGEFEQVLPPVRSKQKREKQGLRKKRADRITSSDYGAWEKFDVEKACVEVDMADIGPVSLDSKKSMDAKKEKLREEAQYEKNRGNTFVKREKWDEAIVCYNRAIELVKDDAIYYANRALCHLMKDSLHQAISDCNEALKLDPNYVKAYQRRASASEKLGSLRAASQDLQEVIRLEPHNNAARKQLEDIKKRMGTKGMKSKSSPISESKSFIPPNNYKPKIIELPDEPSKEERELEKWKDGVGEDINVIKPVKKPPHLRSKRALKNVPIQEIPLGRIDKNTTETDKTVEEVNSKLTELCKPDPPESNKLLSDVLTTEKVENLTAPHNSVQFTSEWKYLKNKIGARGDYLSIIDPEKLPAIFANALESDILSEILQTLHQDIQKFTKKSVSEYLLALSKVKRFSTLTLFLTRDDKEIIRKLLVHCEKEEKLTTGEIAELMELYEV
ncbi:RNA polymerase II-associated protein 3-like isoform X2 [Aricia agestis]|nr:RNA polymerase II-associated protein 3-like isoform X2 [Aricia agestis]